MIYFDEEQWTFKDIELYSNRMANYLLSRGFK
jgi:hypothetical protein